jgi:hypothetical protein
MDGDHAKADRTAIPHDVLNEGREITHGFTWQRLGFPATVS